MNGNTRLGELHSLSIYDHTDYLIGYVLYYEKCRSVIYMDFINRDFDHYHRGDYIELIPGGQKIMIPKTKKACKLWNLNDGYIWCTHHADGNGQAIRDEIIHDDCDQYIEIDYDKRKFNLHNFTS